LLETHYKFMFPTLRRAAVYILCGAGSISTCAAQAQTIPSIRRVQVLRGGNQVEIEIESSAPIVPQTNELGGPNRLLVDFVNAKPGAELRGAPVNRPEVKDLRVGLFSADPPVTRIVIDLNGPQPYQVFPSGRTTIVKIGNPGAAIAETSALSGNVGAAENVSTTGNTSTSGNVSVAPNDPAANLPPAPPKPSLEVLFHDGLLSINSDRASLSEVLFAVHQRTGAEIGIPAGAEQEKVVVNLGPAPAPEVLSQLLNGSKYNFLILSSPKKPGALDQVILSPRAEGQVPAPPASARPQPTVDNANADDEATSPQPGFRPGRAGGPRDPTPPADGQADPAPPANDPPQN
jgi:AMIN domain